MRKFYLLATAMIFGLGALAQSSVTFRVDMNNETVSADGVHLAGSFGDDGYDQWAPDGIVMTDDDTDGVYEVTLTLAGDYYEFKFINGNDWPFEEDVPNICQVELDGNANRSIDVDGDMTYEVCFGECAACGMYSVLLRVDMSLFVENVEPIDANGVHVAGNFQGWDPGATMLTDEDADMVYDLLYSFDPSILDADGGTMLWKYINGNDWFFTNESIPDDCGDGSGNRSLLIEGTNTLTDAYCFGTCGSCVAPTMVTLAVDMTNETVSTNGVHVAGAFQGWNPGATELTDDDTDGIYTVTLAIAPGSYEYKFVNGDNWDADETGNLGNESPPTACNVNNNRLLVVEADTPLMVQYCYNQCEETCVPNPDPADITFRVDMSETPVSADGLWMIGDFTTPQWQLGATEMTDVDSDGVYECTVNASGQAEIKYKFVNGDVDVTDNEESDLADCGLPNGLGGFNRVHIRSGSPEVLDVVCYDSCEACEVQSIFAIAGLETFKVYPNPGNGMINIDLNTTSVLNLNLEVLNNVGQIVYSENLGDLFGKTLINKDLSNLSSGVYSLRLSSNKGQIVNQLIVR